MSETHHNKISSTHKISTTKSKKITVSNISLMLIT